MDERLHEAASNRKVAEPVVSAACERARAGAHAQVDMCVEGVYLCGDISSGRWCSFFSVASMDRRSFSSERVLGDRENPAEQRSTGRATT
jgi:hypothetical protein